MLFCDSRWQCFAWLVNLTAVGLYSFLPYFWCSSVDSIQFHVACCTAVSSRCRNITDISLLQLLMWSGPKCLPADTCRICVLWRGVCCSCNIYRTLGIVCLWVPYFWNMMECIIMCFSILAPIISTFVQILIMSNTSLILLRWIIIMFPYQNTLTQPQTVHAEGNQYTCDVCNKSFFLCTTFSSHWQTHTNSSLSTHVMCVISHSEIRVIWRDIKACILESVCSLAVCVISPTVIRVVWSSILSAYTDLRVRIAVMCEKGICF